MTSAQEISFRRYCNEELSRVKTRDGIGLYEEKRLHSVLKRWLYDDFSAHEQKIEGTDDKKRKFVADVLTPEGEIFEIQTGDLYPLRHKIAFYLEKTDYRVTVVHPIVMEKYVCWLDPETGEITARNRRNVRELPLHGVAQMRHFVQYLDDPRFTLLLPVLSAEEFRLLDGWSKDKKRGSHRYELLPTALLDVCRYASREDYLAAFPPLPDVFTAKEFGKLTHLRGRLLYNGLALLVALGGAVEDGKEGRAKRYRKA